ncbi:DUF262 domain-containing protein [Nitrosococcus wardiae]|uniref:DUF262 domain-containing protein n=1 Tax=Nitrosococcus wardiae TaxID=1814290 RepID=A0A4P7BXI3_9GAMM|nr:DUF262 domain-containing protein [Nitrosococcus wardiae]QBQ53152.1 DUF262 domain-containing protein [Nitrosococcus wardiae]
MHDRVLSQVQTPADIRKGNIAFVIPSYQRPYVWPDEDVLKLFDDIAQAQKTGEPNYYIGTVLTARLQEGSYELIDGQQRMTTLMLMAIAFRSRKKEIPLTQLAIHDKKPRLTFSIRHQVQTLLGHWAKLEDYPSPGNEAVEHNPYLTRLHGALKALQQRLDQLDSRQHGEKIADYIDNKVQWVNNIMPGGMDLNRLFATMNTRGIQLEQSDILKSLLLKQVKTDKPRYEAIWQACEHMENYFERNVRQLFKGTDWANIQPDDLKQYDPGRFQLPAEYSPEGDDNRGVLSISKLAEQIHEPSGQNSGGNGNDKPELDEETVYCRSIIGFPLLLMHAYRIYRNFSGKPDIEVRLHSDRLIESFKELKQAGEEEVKAFIECLWQVRYQFDRWVMKWIERDDEEKEQLHLTEVYPSNDGKGYLNRRQKEQPSALVQLQSVRYFTGERSAQYWLTPFLGRLLNDVPTTESEVLDTLESIDNPLSRTLADTTQKEASFMLLAGELPELQSINGICKCLRKPKGTGYEHYWFQKLEYLLWKHADKSADEKMRKYHIASRNSIEHVHPQNEKYGKQMERNYLDGFGNLVLLNPGQNSSYSNKPVNVKKADFESKGVYDSLKLKRIFELKGDDEWLSELIKRHEDEMIELLSSHYRSIGEG